MQEDLKRINKEIKTYINESNGISQKVRNKIIKLLADSMNVNLPIENFQTIDIILNDDGSITMRGDNYKSNEKLSSKEIVERYSSFKNQVDIILKKKETNAYKVGNYNNAKNIIILSGLLIITIILLIIAIKAFLSGNFFHCIYLIIFISSWFIPSVHLEERLNQAKIFIKRKLKK